MQGSRNSEFLLPANLERLSQVFWATHFGMDSSLALFGSLRPFDEKELDNSFLREPRSSPFKMVATTSIPTFDFQARDFCEKNGFQIFGAIEDYPIGHKIYYLVKKLDRQIM